jgi:hypothetical protein
MTISSLSARALAPMPKNAHGVVVATSSTSMIFGTPDAARSLSSIHTPYTAYFQPREVGPFCVTAAIYFPSGYIYEFVLKMFDGTVVVDLATMEVGSGGIGKAVLSVDVWVPNVNTYFYAQHTVSAAAEILSTFSLRRVA